MYVVKRPFKNLGKVLTTGTVIEDPTVIKRFKGKLAEGKIIEVTERNYDVASKYFKAKYGVSLPAIADKPDADKPDADKPDADKPDADKPDAKVAVAKAVSVAGK